jgi:hypothetical protein
MGDVHYVSLVCRWLHVAAAIVALGGAFFTRLALIPAAKAELDEQVHQRLREALRRRWAAFVHGCVAVLLLTGLLNFWFLALAPRVEPMPYHLIFGVKFLLALFIFFVAEGLVGTDPGFVWMRRARAGWLTSMLVAGAGLVLLSGVLNQLRTHRASTQPTVSKVPAEG